MTQTQDSIDTFFKQFPTSTYPPNSVVFNAGEPSHFFYFIESGVVKMSHLSPEGKNLILHIFFPKAFFPLLTLIQSENLYDFVTLSSTTVRKVPEAELTAFLRTHTEVLFDLQLRLLKGIQGLLNRLEQTALANANDRVADLLLYFAAHFSGTELVKTLPRRTLTVKITHQEIADWLGLSRENVSIQMKQLQQDGFIKMKEHFIEIEDILKLKQKVGR